MKAGAQALPTPAKQEKKVKELLQSYNLVSDQTDELIQTIKDITFNSMKQMSQYKEKVQRIHQEGGRIVLPSEYFGIESGRYGPAENIPRMDQPTDVVARPSLMGHWEGAPLKSPLLSGGAGQQKVLRILSQKDMKQALDATAFKLNMKEVKQLTGFVNNQVQSFMQELQQLVKNSERRVGKSHLRKALKALL